MNPDTPPRIPPAMAPPSPTPSDAAPPDVPPALAAGLRDLRTRVPVSSHIDAAVLANARRAASRRTLQRRTLFAAPLAAAAGLALAVWVLRPAMTGRTPNPGSPTIASRDASPAGETSEALPAQHAQRRLPADLNGDGVIDMRDALVLAQRVRQNTALSTDDQNKDGVVDTTDIDAIAMLAVRLTPAKAGGA